MPKFTLSATVTVSAYTIVEADTQIEAMEIANDRDVEIGGPGSGVDDEESWVIEDGDGVPENVRVDSAT